MEHISLFSAEDQSPVPETSRAVGLDTGETFPIRSDMEQDPDELGQLLENDSQACPEEDEDFDDELVWSAEDVDADKDEEVEEDMSYDEELNELLEMLSQYEDAKDAALRQAQEEIRAELDRRSYHYVTGELDGNPAFFIPSMGLLATHFDLLIILKRGSNPYVYFKVTLPILCGSEMSPALLLRFAELNQTSRYFNWKYSSRDNAISLFYAMPLGNAKPVLPCLDSLLDDALYIPLVFFPEVEWLSTGVVTAPVKEEQLEEMMKFLSQLEDSCPYLSPLALQRLRDGLEAIKPQEDNA